ncbi:hypothetical protein [Paraliobacillus sediminis]|uniref:hypothetical protein n=1 Tax=Paraliobacillus sediminis TaxID=1885916 RepID=UPI000E3C72F8|nr:hypothetical protein [Paraliobacillus sediminis]
MQANLYDVHEGIDTIQKNIKKLERAIHDPEEERDIDWKLINRITEDLNVGVKHIEMEAWKETLKEGQHVTRLRTSIY